jgi:hypothetical protein
MKITGTGNNTISLSRICGIRFCAVSSRLARSSNMHSESSVADGSKFYGSTQIPPRRFPCSETSDIILASTVTKRTWRPGKGACHFHVPVLAEVEHQAAHCRLRPPRSPILIIMTDVHAVQLRNACLNGLLLANPLPDTPHFDHLLPHKPVTAVNVSAWWIDSREQSKCACICAYQYVYASARDCVGVLAL